MMRGLAGRGGMRKWLYAAPFLLFVGLIGWIDRLTGPDLGLSLFYLMPIVVAGWMLGAGPAGLIAITAGCAWFYADVAPQAAPHLEISAWNGMTRLIIFVSMGLLTARVRAEGERLKGLLELETALARTDPMTGLLNSRGFAERLDAEAARSGRSGEAICLGYLDLDDFKRVNDLYGHGAGDLLLQRVGAAIRETIRKGDTPARIGGDEFAILFWSVDREAATAVTRRLIERIRAAGAVYPLASVSASVGIVWLARPPENADAILALADAAMYEAKLTGKGRVVFHSEDDGDVRAMEAGASL